MTGFCCALYSNTGQVLETTAEKIKPDIVKLIQACGGKESIELLNDETMWDHPRYETAGVTLFSKSALFFKLSLLLFYFTFWFVLLHCNSSNEESSDDLFNEIDAAIEKCTALLDTREQFEVESLHHWCLQHEGTLCFTA